LRADAPRSILYIEGDFWLGMMAGDEREYPIDADDLEPLIALLQSCTAPVDESTRKSVQHIADDLMKLPNGNIGQFSVCILNRFSGGGDEQGSGSEWVSLDASEEWLIFAAGSHESHPDTGGDTSSETMFQCGLDGACEGDLADWLRALDALDRNELQILASHELDGLGVAG
jgi:hypothetical protein